MLLTLTAFLKMRRQFSQDYSIIFHFMWKHLSKVDMFGTPFHFTTPSGNTHYQTLIGGLATLIIYSLGALYLIYVVINWKLGCILPRISSTLETAQYQEVFIQGEFMQISIVNQSESQIDPFSPVSNIITPMVVYLDGYRNLSSPISLFSKNSQTNIGKKRVVLSDIEIIQQIGDGDYEKDPKLFFLFFVPCQTQLLQEGASCAPQETIDTFLESFSEAIEISIMVQQYRPADNSLSKIVKSAYMVIDKNLRLYTQIQLQITKQIHDVGMLLQSQQSSEFVSDYSSFSQLVSKEFLEKFFGFDSLAVFFFKLNDLRIEQQIVEIKVTEILAQVGSFMTLLLTIRFLIYMINQSMLKQELVDQILRIYYPKLGDVEIRRNIFGQVMEAKQHNSTLDLMEFRHRYQTALLKVIDDFKISNLISTYVQLRLKFELLEVEEFDVFTNIKVHPLKGFPLSEELPTNPKRIQE